MPTRLPAPAARPRHPVPEAGRGHAAAHQADHFDSFRVAGRKDRAGASSTGRGLFIFPPTVCRRGGACWGKSPNGGHALLPPLAIDGGLAVVGAWNGANNDT